MVAYPKKTLSAISSRTDMACDTNSCINLDASSCRSDRDNPHSAVGISEIYSHKKKLPMSNQLN